jgi:eukaryotic-like serine/threonine-protein kinase
MTTQTQAGPVLSVGSVVADTYQVTRLLGRGGMGAVWEAAHLRLPGKKVAIKVLHADIAGDQEALARFKREAEIASRLGHPNIVEVHDFNSLPDGQPYLVLELLVGESLDSRMRRAPVSLDNAMRIAGQIGAALAAAHRHSVVHRDLKPQNVFLARRGEDEEAEGGEVVKVLDFGISKIRGSQTIKTLDSTILGTPQYMAPEQATGNHAAVDQRTDVFALGAIVYEMLAGRPAFTGQNVPEVVFKVVYEEPAALSGLVPGLPRRVAQAVERALAKKQDERFPDVVSFVEQMAGVSISTLRRSPLVPAPPATGDPDPADPLAHTVDSSRRELAPVVAAPSDAAPPAEPRSEARTEPSVEAPVRRNTARLLAAIGIAAAAVGTAGIALVARTGSRDAASSASSASSQAMSPPPAASPPTAGSAPIASSGPAPGAQPADPAKPPGPADTSGSPTSATGAGDAKTDAAKTDAAKTDAAKADAAKTDAAKADAAKTDAAKTDAAKADAAKTDAAKTDAAKTDAAKTDAAKADAAKTDAAKTDAAKTDAAKTDAAKTGKPPRRRRPAQDEGGDRAPAEPTGDVRAELIDGERALRAADYRQALVLAERALRNGAGPAAHALRARASCAIGDLGNARASFSRIGRRPFLRRQVLSFCTRSGVDLGP